VNSERCNEKTNRRKRTVYAGIFRERYRWNEGWTENSGKAVRIVAGDLASETNWGNVVHFLDRYGALYGRKVPYMDRMFTVITVYGRWPTVTV
jgi:hypothetical protein